MRFERETLSSSNGFILGLIGGLLDFASASLLLLNPGDSMGSMGSSAASADFWAVVLVLLGVAVVATSVLSVQSVGIRFAKLFSILMILYGVGMLAVGVSMTTGYIYSAGISVIYSYGMVLVGGAMVVNGVIMSRTPMQV